MHRTRAVACALLASFASCTKFDATGTTSNRDAGVPEAGAPDGGGADAIPTAADFGCPAGVAPGVFCTTLEDATSPYGAFTLECSAAKSQCAVVAGDRSPHVLSLKTAADGARASLFGSLGDSVTRLRCELEYDLKAAPASQVSSLVAFHAPSGAEIANVYVDATGRLLLHVGSNEQNLPPPRVGWNHLVVTFGEGDVIAASVNGAPADTLPAKAVPLEGVEIGLIFEAAGWDLLLDDVRCEPE